MFASSSTNRRDFLKQSATGAAALATGLLDSPLLAQEPGMRPVQADEVAVRNPRGRVPMSMIIDDSTCLVNLAHFAIPQFHEVFPDRYQQPWRRLPREIPDRFVRKFGEWCHEHGIKGKYSIVPYPACVGWMDRQLPGWSKRELEESLDLVRTLMVPDWDIHPEMVSHTWAINTKTGRPYPERTADFMENWGWSVGKSADQLADYMSYALRVLKNVGLPCEGITTPGGFGTRVLAPLAQATLQSCRDVFNAEVPHYFRHLYTDDRSVAPRVYYASDLDGPDPKCCVSIIGCTGDWFGGWDGLTLGSADRFITADYQGGRLPQVIRREEPAILVCHWPGIYCNGLEYGLNIFKTVVARLEVAYDNLIWMKLSEIARYWAARELTRIEWSDGQATLHAPVACPRFTVRVAGRTQGPPRLEVQGKITRLSEVRQPLQLDSGTWHRGEQGTDICFDLPKGVSKLIVP